MAWTDRQRAMLRAMGLSVWTPPGAPIEAVADASPALPEAPVPSPPAPERPIVPIRAAVAAAAAAEPTEALEPLAGEVATLDWSALRAAVSACRACALCESRTQTVFGVGNPSAHWMIVGEAPGEQEDLRGEPFVGPAGQLLDAMLKALGLTRSEAPPQQQVFIANTLKCRPPRNRNPEPSELARCEPFLRRQLALVQPKVILAMGRFAVQSLLRSDDAIGRLRGRVHRYEGVPLVVTYHPAYLLRQPADKAKAWEDLCLAASLLER
ncbi:MAG TPA: uracil-DNA glycosylase [Ideonella sp.]|uniref:uracil-DNA glycosylase n=1 Tax=Ideonella sp. TaxID=1929293 RepID=UPI002E325F95|nr:uracil-DNA glycosylase [Ideonella sp.]HEX5687750.1 uracil-DNA glycosylase [Ideonella sp.]